MLRYMTLDGLELSAQSRPSNSNPLFQHRRSLETHRLAGLDPDLLPRPWVHRRPRLGFVDPERTEVGKCQFAVFFSFRRKLSRTFPAISYASSAVMSAEF